MVLNKAPNEKFQRTWYSRLAHKRSELSPSAETVPVNTPLQESFWSHDQSRCASIGTTGKGNRVFPPRLSLQSRFSPGLPFRVGTGLISTHTDTGRCTNIWTRFIKRLRSALAAFRIHSAVANSPALPPLSNENRSMQSVQMKDVLYPSWRASDPSDSGMLPTTSWGVSGKGECRVVTSANVRHGLPRSTQGRQRLAGRATRIRLEVMPNPSSGFIAIEKVTKRPVEQVPFGDSDGGTTSLRIPAVEKFAKQPVEDRAFADGGRGTSSMRLPVVEKFAKQPVEDRAFADGDRETSNMRLPTFEKVVRKREELSPAQCTGRFECRQRDVMVSHPAVTESSVVLVTLTANPGPVVVQYVSLQPQVGFTVHLTAPAMIGVPFNYIVL